MVSVDEFQRSEEYRLALEHTRADLWGINEDLRNKIKSLEDGQLHLQEELYAYIKSCETLPPSLADDLSGIASE